MSAAEEQKTAPGSAVIYEEILERCCGGSGRWQILLAAYLSLMWFLLPTFSMSMMFVGATPEFRCADGFETNATFVSLPANTPKCHPANDNSSSCTRWLFDDAVYDSTVVTEWNLVCGRKPLLSMLQSWLMIGGIIGALVSGQLADRFGRKTVFLPAMLLVTCCAFAVALVTNYTAFAVIRLLTGFGLTTMIAGHYVLVTELGGVGQRAALSTVYLLPFAIGVMLVAAGSYAIRTRWLLQLAYAAPWLLFLPSFWLMPESPRWLVVQGRFEEAYRVLLQGALWNNRQMPAKEQVLRLMKEARDGMLAREEALRGVVGVSALQRVLQLVRTPRMRRNTLAIVSIGFVISASFYGISFDVTQLSESPHLAGVLSGLVEVPAYFIFPLLNWLGRRRCMVIFLFLTAVTMFISIARTGPELRLAIGLVAKLAVSSAFSMLGTYVMEVMPTQGRSQALTASQTATSCGAAVAPFVVDLVRELHPAAPSAVFGVAALMASLVTLLLPETMGQRMPETAADVERRANGKERDRGCVKKGGQGVERCGAGGSDRTEHQTAEDVNEVTGGSTNALAPAGQENVNCNEGFDMDEKL